MTDVEIIEDADVIEERRAEVVHVVHDSSPANLFGASSPAEVLEQATALAVPLANMIRDRKLASNISGKEFVRVEGWTTLGSMLGVFPVVKWTRPLEDGSGWEARVEAVTRSGEVVGSAEAMCTRKEGNWKSRDENAIRSMAQTRATSKAMRLPLGFVMQLAGFEATPAEEADFAQSERPSGPAGNSADQGPIFTEEDRLEDGSWPRVCPYCRSEVAERGEDRGNKPKWYCLNDACQGGGAKKRGDGRWPWGSYHDDPWKAAGEIDDQIGVPPVDATPAFDAKTFYANASKMWKAWDEKTRKAKLLAGITEAGIGKYPTSDEAAEVVKAVSAVYYRENPTDEGAPF